MRRSIGRGAPFLAAAFFWLACASSASPAQAASFESKAASTPVEKQIRADPVLSDRDSTLSLLFDQILAGAEDPGAVRAEQRLWLTRQRNTAHGAAALRAAYDTRIAAVSADLYGEPSRDTCIPVASDEVRARKGCHAIYAGRIANAPGRALAFQTQAFADSDGPVKVQVVRYADTGAILGYLAAGIEYDRPKIVQTPAGTALYLLGNTGGIGEFPDDALFLYRDGAWTSIDIQTWLDDLAKRLPKGLSANKGIYPNWKTMTARTALWRGNDPNCCPTGGNATLTLRVQGARLVLDRIELTKQRPR